MSWGSVYLHRQRHPRVNIKLPVEYHPTDETESTFDAKKSPIHSTRIENISEGGLLLILGDQCDIDAELSLRIHIPISFYADRPKISPVEAEARVVWTQMPGESGECLCGVCFTRITPDDMDLLRKFINHCLGAETTPPHDPNP